MKLNTALSLLIRLSAILTLIFSQASKADHNHFSFAMPFSGDKVSHYDIQLEFANNEIKQFHVPDDCGKLISMVNFGSSTPIGLIDRKLWFKTINDCRYVMVMHLNEGIMPANDFVGGYDYFNARLADLPFSTDCKSIEEETVASQCDQFMDGKPRIRSYFPFLEVLPNDKNVKTEECRFVDGLFRGRLVRTDQGVRCQQDRHASGLRLISVDYSDINLDDHMDVVLRIMPLGRGVSRFPVVLPLTRYQADTPFSLVDDVVHDYMLDSR